MLVAALRWWASLRARPALRRTIDGVNAGVVGVLLAAWIDPATTSAIRGAADALFAVALFGLLVGLRWPPWAVVATAIAAGAARGLAG